MFLLLIGGQCQLPIERAADSSRSGKHTMPMAVDGQSCVPIDGQCSLPVPIEDQFVESGTYQAVGNFIPI